MWVGRKCTHGALDSPQGAALGVEALGKPSAGFLGWHLGSVLTLRSPQQPRNQAKALAGVNQLKFARIGVPVAEDAAECASLALGRSLQAVETLSTLWRGVTSTQGGIERELSSFSDLQESFIIQTRMEMISLKSVALRQKPGMAWLLIALQIDIKYSAGATILKIKSFIRSSFLSIFGFDVRKIFYVSKESPVLALGSSFEGRDYSMAVVVHHLLKGRPKL